MRFKRGVVLCVVALLSIVGAACSSESVRSSGETADHSLRRMLDGNDWTTVNLNTAEVSSYCYEDAESHCSRYGRLYTWESARRGCQSLGNGWRLPTDDEWHALAKGYGGLLADSTEEGTPASSPLLRGGTADFNAVMGGSRSAEGRYDRLDAHGFYWTASESGTGTAWFYNFGRLGLSRHQGGDKAMAASVRCIRIPREA